ncbi:MAG TPA: rhomboid family intramembrane serine protease [Verrucomicrobiae bacterium]|jgi:membrane associated rhomboid family serine protease|nr:rhomboid family intramembrane serine protease [Verrucomicrobiae bacterium]
MREDPRSRWSVTTILFVTLIVCFVAQKILEAQAPRFIYNCTLRLQGLREGRFYELITFQFMHASFWHLAGNLLGVYFFGRATEEMFGGRAMLRLYLLSGTIGGLLQIGLAFLFPYHFAGGVVGASAGLFGLVAAFAARAPDDPITMLLFFILPVTFPAKVFILMQAAVSLAGIFGLFGNDNIAHAAHFGGMLTGVFFVRGGPWLSALNLRRASNRRPTREVVARRAWRRPRKRAEELPAGDFISREVDPILEKISAHGIHSLTDQEKQILEAARNKMAKR